MIVKTGRFGQLKIEGSEIIKIPQGILGFPEFRDFCLIDSGDETLILWLQSTEVPEIVFPVLEPRVFMPNYAVHLSAADQRELQLQNLSKAAVFCVLTIPDDVTQMTANLKAPIVINLEKQIAKQVVLQENEYSIKHPMFKELRQHLLTILAQKYKGEEPQTHESSAVAIGKLMPSNTVKSLTV